jgi:hypothetical protein
MHVKSRTLSVEWQVKDREIQGWKNKNTSNTQVHIYIHTYIHDFYIPQFFTFFPMIPGGYTMDIMGKIATTILIIILMWHFEMWNTHIYRPFAFRNAIWTFMLCKSTSKYITKFMGKALVWESSQTKGPKQCCSSNLALQFFQISPTCKLYPLESMKLEFLWEPKHTQMMKGESSCTYSSRVGGV